MKELATVESVARRRETIKLMAEESFPADQKLPILDRLLACAGWAPFHRMCSVQHRAELSQPAGIEPWRFHVLEAADCRRLRQHLLHHPHAGKIPSMLASCEAMLMATWLPNPPSSGHSTNDHDNESFEPTLENVEHIAAASAAIQTLLLAATAAGVDNYWSSGGVLRTAELFRLLDIPTEQRLLGAIFLFPDPAELNSIAQKVGSKLREARGELSAWSRRVTVP